MVTFMILWCLLMYNRAMQHTFYTIADVSEMLKVSQSVVRNLINSGELKAIQIGGRGLWRIEESAVENFIQSQYSQSQEKITSDII